MAKAIELLTSLETIVEELSNVKACLTALNDSSSSDNDTLAILEYQYYECTWAELDTYAGWFQTRFLDLYERGTVQSHHSAMNYT